MPSEDEGYGSKDSEINKHCPKCSNIKLYSDYMLRLYLNMKKNFHPTTTSKLRPLKTRARIGP